MLVTVEAVSSTSIEAATEETASVTASNAAILGATTAPALAATKGWTDLVTPGVLVGVFGYALGTFIGTLVFNLA